MWHPRLGRALKSLPLACAIFFYLQDVLASPAACQRSLAAMFKSSDSVVEAKVTSSKNWKEGSNILNLVAEYRILNTFKGDIQPAKVIIVTDTCWDKPVPQEMLGYPPVKNSCLGGINLSLTGVRSTNGKTQVSQNKSSSLILFLRKDHRPGALQQTWIEVSPNGYGGGCHVTRANLSPSEHKGFDRLPRIDLP